MSWNRAWRISARRTIRSFPRSVPAVVIGLCCNTVNAMIVSQVVLSFVLPLPMIALVRLSSRRSVMGNFAMGRGAAIAAATATVVIVLLNVVLIGELFS